MFEENSTMKQNEDGLSPLYFEKVAKEDCEREFRFKAIQDSMFAVDLKRRQTKMPCQSEGNLEEFATYRKWSPLSRARCFSLWRFRSISKTPLH